MTAVEAREHIEYTEKNKKHTLFWILMVGFMLLIYVRNVMAIEFPVIIFLAYACAMMLFADHDELMALAISFIPFSAAFQYKYAILILIAVYILKYHKNVKNVGAFIPVLLMLAWELLHGVFGVFSFVELLRGFAELIFCSLIFSLSNKKFDYGFIARIYSACVVFACLVALLKLLSAVGYNFETIFLDGDYRFGIVDRDAESYVMNYNANALGFMCNLSIAGLFLRTKIKGANVIDVALIIASAFFGILTLSRSFVLCFIILMLMLMFTGGNSIYKTFKSVLVFGMAAVAIFLILYYGFPYIFDNIIKRFNEDDVTGGRSGLLVWYTEYVFSSPDRLIFGTGLQNVLDKVNLVSNIDAPFVPHNGTQEVVVVWGLPGLALLAYFIAVVIMESRKALERQTFSNYIPLILTLIMVQSGQLITAGTRILMFTFLYIILCTSFEKTKNQPRGIFNERYKKND